MVSCIIDTNVYINLLQGKVNAKIIYQDFDRIFVPFIVLSELEYGFRNGSQYENNRKMLELFLESDNVGILHSDNDLIISYGLIKNRLKFKGKPIPENDIWIAAIAIEQGVLITYDHHFKEISDLDLIVL